MQVEVANVGGEEALEICAMKVILCLCIFKLLDLFFFKLAAR